MRVVTYNIQYSRGRDGVMDLARIADTIRDADIIGMQEVERFWQRSGMVDQPAELMKLLPRHHAVFGSYFDMDASVVADDGTVSNRRRQFGNMLFSRWPIVWTRQHPLPKTHYDDEFNMHQGALEAVIQPEGRPPIRIILLHLAYISMEKGDGERMAQINLVLDILNRREAEGAAWSGPASLGEDDWSEGEAAPANPESVLLLGDFNMVPGSAPYVQMITASAGPHKLVDSWKAVGKRARDGFTYPLDEARYGRPGIKLDYIFASEDVAAEISDAWIDNEADGSDHLPYWIEIPNKN